MNQSSHRPRVSILHTEHPPTPPATNYRSVAVRKQRVAIIGPSLRRKSSVRSSTAFQLIIYFEFALLASDRKTANTMIAIDDSFFLMT